MATGDSITLQRAATGWMATFAGPWAADIVDLFGTATIPTAFTAEADAATVLAEVTAKNPGAVVRLAVGC